MSDQKISNVERSNFAYEFSEISEIVLKEIEAALLAGRYILSEEVDRFENAFATYTGTKYALGVNSGTDALWIALEALDIGPGDEVITVANTFHATALAIMRTGATPVLVDARVDDFLMDQEQVVSKLTPRTKAIIAVHLFGLAQDLSALVALCNERGIALVEDCAQATGAIINGQKVGTYGDIGCFSFHPSKTLAGAGDGGAITTNNEAIANRIRSLRYFGQRQPKIHSEQGHNSKLDTLQAIALYHKLPFLDRWNELRRRQAVAYMNGLSKLSVRFQTMSVTTAHVFHLFQVSELSGRRDLLLAHLSARKIDAVVRYPVPIHLQPAFSSLGYSKGEFPVAESLAISNLCLPIRPDMSTSETNLVLSTIDEFYDA